MKKSLWVLCALMMALAVLFVYSGFGRRTDVYVEEAVPSADGKTLTLHTGIWSSMGYTRAVRTKQVGDTLQCTFYTAFGGLNSKIGAQNVFTVPVEGCSQVAFFRGDGQWDIVLQKDPATGAWDWCK